MLFLRAGVRSQTFAEDAGGRKHQRRTACCKQRRGMEADGAPPTPTRPPAVGQSQSQLYPCSLMPPRFDGHRHCGPPPSTYEEVVRRLQLHRFPRIDRAIVAVKNQPAGMTTVRLWLQCILPNLSSLANGQDAARLLQECTSILPSTGLILQDFIWQKPGTCSLQTGMMIPTRITWGTQLATGSFFSPGNVLPCSGECPPEFCGSE